MTVKRAQHMEIYLCDTCASVHIGFYRNGKLFAEAIPTNAEVMLEEMVKAVAESRRRQGFAGVKH